MLLNALVRLLSLPAAWLAKLPGCGPLIRACSTTVGQKLLMAGTGLALCGFLIAHLAGNLKLFAGEKAFNDYADSLHSLGVLLAAAETGLFAIFALHIGLAISTAAMNRAARQKSYAMKESKQPPFALPSGGASNWMVVTGFIVLLFLVCHILDMKLKAGIGVEYPRSEVSAGMTESEFLAVKAVLTTPLNALIYFVGIFALGIHLSHGVRSALQTLGICHPRWNLILKWLSIIFGWVIAAGFISLIAWAFASPA